MFWNFFATEQSPLPHDGAERPRRHSKKAPTSTFLGSKQRQKVARVATSGAEIDQNSEKKIFSDFQRFQDFHRARSAHPLGTPTRPCRTFHRDSPTKKARTKGLLKKVAIKSLNFFLGPSNEKEAAHVGKLKKSEGKSEKKIRFLLFNDF